MDVQLTTVYVERFVSSIISFNDSMNNTRCVNVIFQREKVETIISLFHVYAVD